MLEVGLASFKEVVERAAKQKRIECHPYRLKRRDGLSRDEFARIDKRAEEVGCAADILTNPALRSKYDRQVAAGKAE